MELILKLAGLGLAGTLAAGAIGCGSDQPPTPERARMAQPIILNDPSKPLSPSALAGNPPAPPYDDIPLVTQQMPEQRAFVNAYNGVGRPRILVFVNRAPDIAGNAPLKPDDLQARSLDYAAVENILSDWLSADGRVAVISPAVGQQMLNAQQTRDLQSGKDTAGRDVAKQVAAPILVQVRAQPTRQTLDGMQVRMVAEAIDLQHGGASLARAVVDVAPPLDKVQINTSTRFMARKLMDGMINSWQALGALQGPGAPVGGPPAQSGSPVQGSVGSSVQQPRGATGEDLPSWPPVRTSGAGRADASVPATRPANGAGEKK
ncbi:MAG TPA: hypothetical protein VFC78_10455 [Tepidisphaeraceae bacterium]|nr:hypothetical protein [Tepidisphaeraceae bacterium]